MRDPNGAISCCPADRSIACGDDLTWGPSEHIFLMGTIQIARQAQHRSEDAWKAIRAANLPEDRGARFSPVNGTISLLHGGLPTAFDLFPAIIKRFWHKGVALNFVYG